jgi:2'-5' RNA ligase
VAGGGGQRWRVFCGLDLPAGVRERVAERITLLRESCPNAPAAWVRRENLHLTLKFVGEVEPARAEELSAASARAATGAGPFALTISAAGAFPRRGAPRVLWLGVEDESGGLASLHRRLEDECEAAGFARDDRPFSPHLTLARAREQASARRLADLHRQTPFEPQTFQVAELLVIRSELSPGGSRYTALSRHLL